MMKFIYLIQSDSDKILFQIPGGSDRLLLQWQSDFIPCSHSFHFPQSTWASGRNELFRRARERAPYDYFIFADDDLELFFDLKDFETMLETYQPPRAVPHVLAHPWNKFPRARIDRVKYVDHSLMALRAEYVANLMPYSLEFDKTCWWLSSEDFCQRFWQRWPLETLRFNQLEFTNVKTRPYPRERNTELPRNVVRTHKGYINNGDIGYHLKRVMRAGMKPEGK